MRGEERRKGGEKRGRRAETYLETEKKQSPNRTIKKETLGYGRPEVDLL